VATADDYAVDSQKQELTAYAEKHGYANIKIYEDNGFSGLTLIRPAFNELQADIQAGRVSTVIVKSASRVGRNMIDVMKWVWDITELGVDFISLIDPNGFLSAELSIDAILAAALKGGDDE